MSNFQTVKVLIVDDEQLDLFITKKLLSLEFEVAGFTSITEATNWAKSNSFDVALIDYYLGHGVHAHDVLRDLFAIKGKTFRAFVLSNYVDGKQVQQLKEAGFADVIFKPFTIEKFKDLLSQAAG
jgi:DNA-binding NtrC family response regulator